jgi:hypothetical protein
LVRFFFEFKDQISWNNARCFITFIFKSQFRTSLRA